MKFTIVLFSYIIGTDTYPLYIYTYQTYSKFELQFVQNGHYNSSDCVR